MTTSNLPWRRWFPALEERSVRVYVFGQSVSIMGTWVLDILLNLVLWQATRSPGLLGLLNFVLYVPGLVLTPWFSASLSADNARRRTLGVLAGGLAVASLLALLSAMGWLGLGPLLLLAGVRGVLNGLEQPARQMLLASAVAHPDRIGGAVALNTTVFQLARMTGPALASVLFASVGAAWGFVFSACAITVMIACVLRVEPGGRLAAPPAAGRGGLRGAVDFVRGDRYARLFVPVVVAMAALAGGYQTLVPVLADRVFGDTARWTSWFFVANGAGALAAALLLSTGAAHNTLRLLPVPLPWLVALALLGLGFGSGSAALPALLCFVAIGFGMTLLVTSTSAVLHRRVPPQARNGLIALLLMAFNGVLPVAQLLAGQLAEHWGAQRSLQLMGLALVAALLLLFVPRWRSLRRFEFDAQRI